MNRKTKQDPELKEASKRLQLLIEKRDLKGVARELDRMTRLPHRVGSRPRSPFQTSLPNLNDKELTNIKSLILDKLEAAQGADDYEVSLILLKFLSRMNRFRRGKVRY